MLEKNKELKILIFSADAETQITLLALSEYIRNLKGGCWRTL